MIFYLIGSYFVA